MFFDRNRLSSVKPYQVILLLVCCLCVPICHSADFHAGDVEGLFDLTLAYGLGVRVNDADDELVAIANGGKAANANKDDGDLNYKEGIISNAARLNADLTLAWQNFGAFHSGLRLLRLRE
jgi:hypothetical protein